LTGEQSQTRTPKRNRDLLTRKNQAKKGKQFQIRNHQELGGAREGGGWGKKWLKTGPRRKAKGHDESIRYTKSKSR